MVAIATAAPKLINSCITILQCLIADNVSKERLQLYMVDPYKLLCTEDLTVTRSGGDCRMIRR